MDLHLHSPHILSLWQWIQQRDEFNLKPLADNEHCSCLAIDESRLPGLEPRNSTLFMALSSTLLHLLFATLTVLFTFLKLGIRSLKPKRVPSLRAVGVLLLDCSDCGFESRWAKWMSVCCEYCVLSGRGLCDRPITRPEESYRLWCVLVCVI